MALNLSTVMTVCMSLLSFALFVQAYRVYFYRKKKWRGQFLECNGFKREMLGTYLGLLGIMAGLETFSLVSDTPLASSISGLAKLGAAAMLIKMVSTLHAEPKPIGLTMKNIQRESHWFPVVILVLIIWGVLNIFFDIQL